LHTPKSYSSWPVGPHTTRNTLVFAYVREDPLPNKLWFAETIISACLGFHAHKMLGHHASTRAGRDLQMRPDGFVEISTLSTRMREPQERVASAQNYSRSLQLGWLSALANKHSDGKNRDLTTKGNWWILVLVAATSMVPCTTPFNTRLLEITKLRSFLLETLASAPDAGDWKSVAPLFWEKIHSHRVIHTYFVRGLLDLQKAHHGRYVGFGQPSMLILSKKSIIIQICTKHLRPREGI
jgi:hypothetical protein